jgi:hypothetical protein
MVNKKKKFLNIFFQISIIFLIVSLFYSDDLEISKILRIFTKNFISIFFLLIFLKFSISLLFACITMIITKNNSFLFEITNNFLLGGLVSASIPVLGLIYKYQKFNNDLGITLAEYTSCQILGTFFSILSYLTLAFLFGFLKVNSLFSFNLYMLSLFLLFLLILFIYKKRKIFFYLPKSKKIYHELSTIKKILSKNYSKFLIIFFCYIIISFLQCYAFYKTILFFEYDLNFITTSYLFISSTMLSLITLINFIGFFELILTYSASIVIDNYIEIIVVGFSFRILNLGALSTSALIMYLLNILKRNKN